MVNGNTTKHLRTKGKLPDACQNNTIDVERNSSTITANEKDKLTEIVLTYS